MVSGRKPVQEERATIQEEHRQLLVPANNDPWPEVRDTLNTSMRGWSNYFCCGTRRAIFRSIDLYVYERVRDFLAQSTSSGRARNQAVLVRNVYSMGLMRLERLP